MKLGDYLKSKNMTHEAFGVRIDRNTSSVTRYCNGRIPNQETMVRIAAETDNEVTANDFYGIAPARPPAELADVVLSDGP